MDQWPMPWLEALGLLAVVFAAGTGVGFWLSFLFGRRPAHRKRPAQRPVPPLTEAAPAEIAPAPEALQEDLKTPAPEPVSLVSQPTPQAAFNLRQSYHINSFGSTSLTRPNPDQSSN